MEITKHLQLLEELSGDPTCAGARLTSNELSERLPLMWLTEGLRLRSSMGQVCFRSTAPLQNTRCQLIALHFPSPVRRQSPRPTSSTFCTTRHKGMAKYSHWGGVLRCRSSAPQAIYFTFAFNAAGSHHPRSSDARSRAELFDGWTPPPKQVWVPPLTDG